MKTNKFLKLSKVFILTLIGISVFSCKVEDDILDNSLRILSQKINNVEVLNGIDNIFKDVAIELILSHSLKPSDIEAALSFTGGNTDVDFAIEYSNTNSTMTISTNSSLEFETTYTIAITAGSHGSEGESLKSNFFLSFTTAPFVPPNVTLSSDVNAISETGEVATVTATLSEPVGLAVTVDLSFGGTATEASDYTASGPSIVIAVGETTATMTLTAIQDASIEGTEAIEVSISQITNAEEITPQMVSISIIDDDRDSNGDGFPDKGFIINEVLFDPPTDISGDANGDGTRSASGDEFIEFVNDSDQPIDLSGYTLYDASSFASNTPRHIFAGGTIIPAGGIYVLFGGGSPSGDFGTAIVAVSTTSNLNLNNGDDQIIILDDIGNTILTFDTQVEGAGIDFGNDQSVTRSPDINGNFALHTTANINLVFSPGKKSDGTNFAGNTPPGQGFIINEVLFDPASDITGDANGDGTRDAAADEFIEFINDSNLAVDLSGYTLYDATNLGGTPLHTFPQGTIVSPGGVYVLFGGGTPTGSFGGAMVGVSTSGNMNLTNSNDIITILDNQGNVFLTFDTQLEGAGISFGSDQSVTRSPDINGNFTLHTTTNPALLFSPGTKTDGSGF
jgi:hypothetical protein